MKQLAAGKITRRAAPKIDKARLAPADKRLVRVNRQLLQHRIQIALDGFRILVGINAKITKVAALAAKGNVRIHPERRVRRGCALHGGFNLRHGFLLPKRKWRVIGNEIIPDSRLRLERRLIGDGRVGQAAGKGEQIEAIVSNINKMGDMHGNRASNLNFKNLLDTSRVRVPFGIGQIGKSFRNEITPRNFTFRSREFEQMEIEFFCRPDDSRKWYQFWRDRRWKWYLNLGLTEGRLQLREHHEAELAHYSCGTADIEYAFPFLADGEYGELEGIAHRGDFDLRSHMEGKLVREDGKLVLETDSNGKPKHRGSGRDLSYFDDVTRERFVPHVIEPSAGADRAVLAFLCDAYHEDNVPDEKGNPRERTVLKLHPRLAPLKAAILPLVKKDGMPEVAADLYKKIKKRMPCMYDAKGSVGRRYARQDEAGTPWCITIDGQTMKDQTVTLRDRDSLNQERVPIEECAELLTERLL